MKIKHKLLLIMVIAGLAACKKDSPVEEKDKPETLALKDITFKDGIKVYTRNGEVTDPVTKAKAIVSTGINLISHQANQKDSVTFLNINSFKMSNDIYSFEKKGDQYLFTSPFHSSLSTDGLAVMMIQFYKFTGFLGKEDNGSMDYNRQFVAYGNNNLIKLSGLDICYLKRDEQTGKIDKRVVQSATNEFDINSISKLGTRDTLAIREYSFNYSK